MTRSSRSDSRKNTCWNTPSIPVICGDLYTTNSYRIDNTQGFCDGSTNPRCGSGSQWGAYVDPETGVVILPGADIREELALLKANLQKHMAAVDAKLDEVEKAAKPTSVEQIDALKSQLLAAVAELDQQRTQMEGGGQAQAQG
jgi:hypothetical protein